MTINYFGLVSGKVHIATLKRMHDSGLSHENLMRKKVQTEIALREDAKVQTEKKKKLSTEEKRYQNLNWSLDQLGF